MKRANSKFLISLLIGAIGFVVLNIFWLHWFRPHTTFGSTWRAALFSDSGRLHGFVVAFANWRTLVQENEDLRYKLQEQLASRVATSQLQLENNRLRSALGLVAKTKRSVIPASIYNISVSPDGYTAIINLGSNNNIAAGDIVVGEHNILTGIVQAVFSTSARVALISDPSFKVTALVLGGQAKGIARGALDKGMVLDLVVQSDEIQDGDIIVSSGDDMVPSGLVIGTVNHVEDNSAKLFKQVTITPSAQFIVGDVYILK